MDAVAEDRDDDWYRIWCDLCWPNWRTMGGKLHVCEDEAADHLEAFHPRRYAKAHARSLITYRSLVAAAIERQHPQSPYCN
jgi:hypothetical protein